MGFDDLPVAQWVGPPLTTVRQPLVEMAVAAAELVLRMANGEAPRPGAPRAGHRADRPREHRAAPRLIVVPARAARTPADRATIVRPAHTCRAGVRSPHILGLDPHGLVEFVRRTHASDNSTRPDVGSVR